MTVNRDYYCSATKRQADEDGERRLCRQRAGWGTDHPGTGHCKLHGGSAPVIHGLYSKTTTNRLTDRASQLRDDPSLLDLRDRIASQSAVIEEYLSGLSANDDLSAEETQTLVGLQEIVSRNIERFVKLDEAKGIKASDLNVFIGQVVAIVRIEADPATAERIGRRLLGGKNGSVPRLVS